MPVSRTMGPSGRGGEGQMMGGGAVGVRAGCWARPLTARNSIAIVIRKPIQWRRFIEVLLLEPLLLAQQAFYSMAEKNAFAGVRTRHAECVRHAVRRAIGFDTTKLAEAPRSRDNR